MAAESESPPSPSPYITDVKPFLRCWAKGSRLQWLESYISPYTSARNCGAHLGTEFAASVVKEYLAKYPWYLKMDVEPTNGSESEALLPLEVLALKQVAIERLQLAIPKWLAHRYNKADPISKMTKKEISSNPVAAILAKVGDINVEELQRARTPQQLWSKTNKATLDAEFNPWFANSGMSAKTQRLTARQHWVDRQFKKLDKVEKKRWQKAADDEKAQLATAKDLGKEPLHRLEPGDLQKALDGLAGVLQPLLEGLHETLGGNIHFFWAGPEPKKGGQVNVISLHVGNDKASPPKPFDSASGERGQQRRKYAEAAIGEFAMECYSLEDQESRALPGFSMPHSAPSFMRQAMPWNQIGSQNFTVIPSLLHSPTPPSQRPTPPPHDPSPSAPSKPTKRTKASRTTDVTSTKTQKRKRDSGNATTSRKRARKGSRDVEEDEEDESDEDESEHREDNPGPPRLTRSRAVLNDITNITSGSSIPIPIDPLLMDLEQSIPTNGPLDSPSGPDTTMSRPDILPPPLVPLSSLPSSLPSSSLPPSSLPSSPSSSLSSSTSPFTTASMPYDLASKLENAPEWLSGTTGIPWLQSLRLGPDFAPVLDALIELEAMHGFSKKKPLPFPKLRPSGVQYWVQCGRARYPAIPPMAGNIRKTASDFWMWWAKIQPTWRGVSATDAPFREQHRPLNSEQQDWGAMQTSGCTGHFSTVAALAFWGQACHMSSESVLALGEWLAAVEDVTWALRVMAKATVS